MSTQSNDDKSYKVHNFLKRLKNFDICAPGGWVHTAQKSLDTSYCMSAIKTCFGKDLTQALMTRCLINENQIYALSPCLKYIVNTNVKSFTDDYEACL
jgi:hypothetical protein